MVDPVNSLNLVEFLQDLKTQGVELWVESGKLRYRGKKEALTPQVFDQIKQYKPDIVNLLTEKRESTAPYPLSLGQQALWFLYRLAPESVAYNMTYAVSLKAHTDRMILEQAYKQTIARHPSLRNAYKTIDGQPVQQIYPDWQAQFEVTETDDLSQEYLDCWLAKNADRPFSLERGEIIRAYLLNRHSTTDSSAKGESILLIVAHHIAMDFWSLDILMDDLCLLYQSLKSGNAISLPPLNIQYQDYVRREQEKLTDRAMDEQWQYWQKQLAGKLPVLNLSTDKPRPAIQTYNGVSFYFTLDEKLSQGIRDLAKNTGSTAYATVLAAFQVLLFRYTSQSELLIGCPMAGRIDPELEKIIGYFVNPVVLRANLAGNPTFRSLIPKVRQTLLEALDYQDLPFPLLVKKLQPERDPSRSPLFQAALVWDRSRQSENELVEIAREEVILDYIAAEQRGAEFDLLLTLFDSGSSLQGNWRYNTDLFDATTIERMADHFQTLLESIVAHPDRPISELSLLTKTEKQQLLVGWNSTQVEYPQDRCIHQLFEARVAKTPDAIAVVFESQQLTYRELNTRANQLAHYLQAQGVKPETLVAICIERSQLMVIGLLAILKAGGAYVPLDPNYPQERLTEILSDSQASIILTQEDIAQKLPQTIAQLICLDNNLKIIERESTENPVCELQPHNLAYIIYTSGSTGKPKGVQIEHRSAVNLLNSIRKEPGLTETDTVLAVTTISFDVAVPEIFLPLSVGAKLIVVSSAIAANGQELLRVLNASKATFMHPTPITWRLLLAAGWQGSKNLKMVSTGEALSQELAAQLLPKGAELWNLYGPTEITVWATGYKVEFTDRPILIGRPLDNTQTYILDSNRQQVPIGVPGELHIGGIGLARGYLNRPELTAEKFIWNETLNSRLYKTGDLVRYLSDGNIECLGRIDNQVKVRGFRIELGEIESILNTHPEVQQAVIIAPEDSSGNKRLVAYITSSSESIPTATLRQFLKQKLPEYMMPSIFVVLDELPLTSNGKIDRRSLPAPEQFQSESVSSFIAPQDELELQLTKIWEKVLGIKPIGIKDNFFEIGGHSFLAILLFAEIEKSMGKQLPLAALFQAPNIKELANLLRDEGWSSSWTSLVPIKPGGSRRPFFCMHGAGGHVLNYYSLSRYLSPEQPFYALQAQGLDGKQPFHENFEDMAAHYIQEIRELQPEGPYFLGGYCGGGKIAFEMAQQLRALGQEVGLLAFFNTFNLPKISQPASSIEQFSGKVKFLFQDIGYHWGNLSLLKPKDKLAFLRERMRWGQRRLQTRISAKSEMGSLASLHKLHDRLVMEYEPKVYPGQITIFQTRKLNDADYDSRLGWEGLAEAGIEFHEIPAYFRGILVEPFVKNLAEQLETCLENAENSQ